MVPFSGAGVLLLTPFRNEAATARTPALKRFGTGLTRFGGDDNFRESLFLDGAFEYAHPKSSMWVDEGFFLECTRASRAPCR